MEVGMTAFDPERVQRGIAGPWGGVILTIAAVPRRASWEIARVQAILPLMIHPIGVCPCCMRPMA